MKTFEGYEKEIETLKTQLDAETARAASFESELEKARCFIGNIDEYIAINQQYFKDVDGDGKVDKLPFKSWIALLQNTWDKIKESRKECLGKDTVVKLPGGLWGSIISALLGLLGLKI